MTGSDGAHAPTATDVSARRKRGLALRRERSAESSGALARLTVLSSFNADLLPPFLVDALDKIGIAADVRTGEFGQIAQEALNPASELYRGEPRDVLMIPAAEDMLAPLYTSGGQTPEEQQALVSDRLDELRLAVNAVLERVEGATCYVVAFGATRAPSEHVLDPTDPGRGQWAVTSFVDGVRGLARESPRVVVIDWDWHARTAGTAAFADERLWYLGRMRLAPVGLAELADLAARYVAAYHGRARKVAAFDLDGTIWGEVVGEAGLAGLELGDEGAGLAYQDFQRELLSLRDTGVLLVACSKNNREEVVEVFERHPGMILRLSHLAAERINWQDKATNLSEIAAELALSLDSFVFLDDSPVEREWVKQALPDVLAPDLPRDPAHRPSFLRQGRFFDRVTVTEADLRRAGSYAAQSDRRRLQGKSPSYEDFLRSLEQRVSIESVTDVTLLRATQLCQRTNQFNLTTRRHTAADLERMLTSEDWELYTVAVKDRFGDSGITGLAIVAFDGDQAEIDTLLLSCRVLGRRVEDALLAFVASRAAARDALRLVGRYVPTATNHQAATFFSARGFEETEAGAFHLDLTEGALPMPDEMTVKVQVNA